MLSEHEIAEAYTEALRFVSRSRHVESDEIRQYMADALRDFHDRLEAQVATKRSAFPSSKEESSRAIARARIA
jgi:hypothetical protein